MDLSEKNILMCEKAEEIQKLWQPKGGDWIAFPRITDKSGQIQTASISEFIEIYKNKSYQVLSYWRGYMLQDENAPDIWLKGFNSLAVNWKKHIKEFQNDMFWLPRFDQLIEILNYHWQYAIEKLYKYREGNGISFPPPLTKISMEMFLLLVVMKEKYNKIWYSEKWIDVNKSLDRIFERKPL